MEELSQPFPPGATPADLNLTVKVWNSCGAKLDHDLLETFAEMYGIEDIEILLVQLVIIRDFKWPKQQ